MTPTHSPTKSKNQMRALLADIRENGVQKPIKVVEHNGNKYIVDGHHRYFAAQKLGIEDLPVKKVELPYLGYRTPSDFIDEVIRMRGYWRHL
ncbi:ParB/RepB/Spo0J family partition protein [Paraburkholderia sp. UCT2]|uniref:ParB/RepB/Spo0J family partition protein n=1 Tax=Paraburkholderia sp. UCT2 TaxID=2615208 RepID=UPI001654E3D4|nr:ParB/RepB/Spo0J family partition protein [Paraburkholderia sp. UCT2]